MAFVSNIFKYFLKSPKKRIIRVCLNQIGSMSLLWLIMFTERLFGLEYVHMDSFTTLRSWWSISSFLLPTSTFQSLFVFATSNNISKSLHIYIFNMMSMTMQLQPWRVIPKRLGTICNSTLLLSRLQMWNSLTKLHTSILRNTLASSTTFTMS